MRATSLLTVLLALGCSGEIGDPSSTAPQTPTPSGPTAPLPDADECAELGPDVDRGRWRRLTASQYANAVTDLIGVTPDTSTFLADSSTEDSPFPTNVAVEPQALDIDNYWTTAEALAAEVDLDSLVECSTRDEACAESFVARLGRRAYRRPLTTEQQDGLMAIYRVGAEESFDRGAQLVLQALLQSPEFLYQVELGTDGAPGDDGTLYRLDGYEVATRLSFLLWNTTPDDALLDAAAAGMLDTAEGVQAEAMRLMENPRFSETLVDFHLAVARVTRIDDVTRSEMELTDEVRAAMVEEARAFVTQVMEGEGTVDALFTAPVTPSDELDMIHEGGPARAGLLTLPAVLLSSPPIETHFAPTYRGNSIRTFLLCDPVAPPDFEVEFEGGGDLTARERLRQHKDNPGCANCHDRMDPIGFALENYDDLGRWRDEDGDGYEIDPSGYVVIDGESNLDISGPEELGEAMAALPEVRRCMAVQWFRYTVARDPSDRDLCSLSPIVSALQEGEGDVRSAVRELVASHAFRFRRGD